MCACVVCGFYVVFGVSVFVCVCGSEVFMRCGCVFVCGNVVFVCVGMWFVCGVFVFVSVVLVVSVWEF